MCCSSDLKASITTSLEHIPSTSSLHRILMPMITCGAITRAGPLVRFIATSFPRGRDLLARPAPPPLPAAEQREFEELLKAASRPAVPEAPELLKGEELHPDARRKPSPEFVGDTNPITGEIGGPKREPVRHNDWSYGGRATDF